MSFKLIDNHMTPAEGEVVVRTYHCTRLSPVFAVIGLKIAGYLTVTNKRVVFFAEGSSLFGAAGKSRLFNDVPIADVANMSMGQGTRFSFWRLIGALIVSAAVGGIVALTQAHVAPLLGFGNPDNPYMLRLGIFLQLVLAVLVFLGSFRRSREDGGRVVLSSIVMSLLTSVAGFASIHGSIRQPLPMPYFIGMAIFILASFGHWLLCLYWFVKREYICMDISSKSGFSRPITIMGVSWRGRINVAAYYARGMAPAVDANAMFKELGAIVTDIQTLGDHGVEKWLKPKPDDSALNANMGQQRYQISRAFALSALTAILLIGCFVGVESILYSQSEKASLASRKQNEIIDRATSMQNEVVAAREAAVSESSIPVLVPLMLASADLKMNEGDVAFAGKDYQAALLHWKEALKAYADIPRADEAMRQSQAGLSQYEKILKEHYLNAAAGESLRTSSLMAEFSTLMSDHPASNSIWSIVNRSEADARGFAEQGEWRKSGNAWDYAWSQLPEAVQLMRADLWVKRAEQAIKEGLASNAYEYTKNALVELPSYSVALQRQHVALCMLKYRQRFFAEIKKRTVDASDMGELTDLLDTYGGANWIGLNKLVAQCKASAMQNEWENCSAEWDKVLAMQAAVINVIQMEKIEKEARRGNWPTVANLADIILVDQPRNSRLIALKDKAISVQNALDSERKYQQELAKALKREAADGHIQISNMDDFMAHMDKYGHEEWLAVKEAINSAEMSAKEERGAESSNAWILANAKLPSAVSRMRAEMWMEKAEQEAIGTNWTKVLVYCENALKEKKDHARALKLRDQADEIEEIRFKRAKYEQIFNEAARHMTDLGGATNDQETLVACLNQYAGVPWASVKSRINTSEELEKQGKRAECVASWIAASDELQIAVQEMRAQYWVEQAKIAAKDNLLAKVDLYIQRALLEKPDHIPAKMMRDWVESVPEIRILRNRYDQLIKKASDQMPEMGGGVGDQAEVLANLVKYSGHSGKILAERLALAATCEKQERWTDCVAAWRLVLETFPTTLLKARSGFWLAKAEDNAKDELWEKAIISADKALEEDPGNERAMEVRLDAVKRAEAKAAALKKISAPPENGGQPKAGTSLEKNVPSGGASIDPNEKMALATILAGGSSFVPKGKSSIDAASINELLVLAGPLRREVKAMDLIMSPRPSQDYLAAVHAFWGKAVVVPGEFGERIRGAAWQVINSQLAIIADTAITGVILSRSPTQQARARREFIKLLSRIDSITSGRVSDCSEQEALRTKVSLFFSNGFFSDALLAESVGDDVFLETHISWIKELFANSRENRGAGVNKEEE